MKGSHLVRVMSHGNNGDTAAAGTVETDLRLAEALRAGQGLTTLLSAIDSLPDAVLAPDSKGDVSHYNSALVTLYGDAAKFLDIGKPFADLVNELAVSGLRYGALPESANALRDGKRRRVAVAPPKEIDDIGGTTQIVRRLALHALAPCDYEELTADGRWLHVATRQVP